MLKNSKPQVSAYKGTDYGGYILNGKEYILYFAEALLLVGVISYFFYRSVYAAIFLSPLALFFLKNKKKELSVKRRRELSMQFKDAILAVSANQKAGYSVENAFKEAGRDMALLYGWDSCICKELAYIAKGLDNNIILEKLLYDFAVRSHIADILQFADVFMIAKRSGGNMTEILSETADVIEQKISVDKDIQVLISSKKMEQKIMNVIPFIIISYIDTTSKGFFDSLYHNPAGIIIMTICLAVYLSAFLISRKLVEIEV